MLSRGHMIERSSRSPGLLQVQYAFLELPKLPKRRPDMGGPGVWAWLFVHAPELEAVPSELPQGPYRQALELANQASFTQGELDAYQQVSDEIRQVLEIAAAKRAEGKAGGKAEGSSKPSSRCWQRAASR